MAGNAQPEKTDDPQKHTWASKLAVAAAFSAVGAKLGLVGLIADANEVLGAEKMSFIEKLKSAFNGTFFKSLKKRKKELMEVKGKNFLEASFHLTKNYMIASTVIGFIAGIVGWVRGGEIENPKDIVNHPIKSTKVILGLADASILNDPEKTAEQKTEASSIVNSAQQNGTIQRNTGIEKS